MWIGRRPDGTVYGAFTVKQADDEFHPLLEEVSDQHPDYVAFRDRNVGHVDFDPVAEIIALKAKSLALKAESLALKAESDQLKIESDLLKARVVELEKVKP